MCRYQGWILSIHPLFYIRNKVRVRVTEVKKKDIEEYRIKNFDHDCDRTYTRVVACNFEVCNRYHYPSMIRISYRKTLPLPKGWYIKEISFTVITVGF